MTEMEVFEAYCEGMNNLCKTMQETQEQISRDEAERALAHAKTIQFKGAGDVLLFSAAINLMNAYVKQGSNKKDFGYSFKSHVPRLLDYLRSNFIDGVDFCTVQDRNGMNVTMVQICGVQFSFHCIKGEKPSNTMAIRFDGIRKQKCAGTLYRMAEANLLMRGFFLAKASNTA